MSEANGGVEQSETSEEKNCRRPTYNRFGKQTLTERNGNQGRTAVFSGDNATLGTRGGTMSDANGGVEQSETSEEKSCRRP